MSRRALQIVAASVTWERLSVNVSWRLPLVMAVVTHLVTRPNGCGLTTWKQTRRIAVDKGR